jgi:hypothetical protein
MKFKQASKQVAFEKRIFKKKSFDKEKEKEKGKDINGKVKLMKSANLLSK